MSRMIIVLFTACALFAGGCGGRRAQDELTSMQAQLAADIKALRDQLAEANSKLQRLEEENAAMRKQVGTVPNNQEPPKAGKIPTGPFCQSCSMPMEKPDDFGTGADGFKQNDYCTYCFKDGTFTDPDITKEQMIEKCVKIMTERKQMPAEQAEALMKMSIPKLKRWQGK